MHLRRKIQGLLGQSAKTAFLSGLDSAGQPELVQALQSIEITPATQEQFGHFQCNSAMKLGKILKLNPRAIAQAWVAASQAPEIFEEAFEKLEIAGPGFINIWLKPSFIAKTLGEIYEQPKLGFELAPGQKQKMIVEFSAPNIAKEMHVGHLRTTIIGECLARGLEWAGHEVLRLNHVGDWGTQFGMLIQYIETFQAQALARNFENIEISTLAQWYKASKEEFDKDPEFKQAAREAVVRLQSGDAQARNIWETLCKISRQAFQEIYDLLGSRLTERGESYYNPDLPGIVESFKQAGLLYESDRASCVKLQGFKNREGEDLPLIIQKGDGGYNYATTDLAAIKNRAQVEKAQRVIYVVDGGQAQHFEMIFAAAEAAGFYDPKTTEFIHVPFGLVLRADGKKFKTREGQTEKLIDLIYGAIVQAQSIIQERSPDLPNTEQEALAKIIGTNAIKYADLSCNRTQNYMFSYDKMLKFEGNTAVFLMYAYVRIQGIKRKAGLASLNIKGQNAIILQDPHELSLALHLIQFADTLEDLCLHLLPNRLCDYLYRLAEKFHAFFHHCRVEGSENQESRLLLCDAAAKILETGMHILGLECVQKM
ncbi:MAG: arginine--tRNA ligase [Gammaproteobacteria bacterium]